MRPWSRPLTIRHRWNGHNFFVHKIVVVIRKAKKKLKKWLSNVGRVSIACTKCLGQIRFCAFEPCVLPAEANVFTHVFLDSNSRSRSASLPISAAMSIVHLRARVNTPFRPTEKVISRCSSFKIFSPSLAYCEHRLCEPRGSQCTTDWGWGGQGALWGGLENPILRTERHIWKTQHLRKMAFHASKKLRTAFFPQKQSIWSVWCWHKFYGQHFLRSSRLSIKFLPAADPLPERRLQGALRLCFPDSLTRELLAVPTPLLPHVNTDRFLPLTNPRCWRSDSEVCWIALSRMDWHVPWPKWGCSCVQRIEISNETRAAWRRERKRKLGFQDHVTKKIPIFHTPVLAWAREQLQDGEEKTQGGPENLILFLRSFGFFWNLYMFDSLYETSPVQEAKIRTQTFCSDALMTMSLDSDATIFQTKWFKEGVCVTWERNKAKKNTRTRARMHTHTRTHAHAHARARTHARTHTHTDTHAQTHTHTQSIFTGLSRDFLGTSTKPWQPHFVRGPPPRPSH